MNRSISLFLSLMLLAASLYANPSTIVRSKGVDPTIRITPPAPKFTDDERRAELSGRRAAVAAKMADKSMLILFSAEPKLYTNDVDYVYRQENNLYYLTALKQNGVTFVMTKDGASVREFIFIPKRNPQFETWNGRMYTNEDASAISGVADVFNMKLDGSFLESLKEKKAYKLSDDQVTFVPENVYLLLPSSENDSNGNREYRFESELAKSLTGYKVNNSQSTFSDLRHIKSPYELKLLQHAIDITTEAQMRSMAIVGPAKMEYEVQAEVEYTFRRRNADFWGYPSIVGCGPNATTLHYVESQGEVKQGDLLLMDVGAEYEHYTADVTRTFPVSGKFTKEQAEIYRIVYDAQEAAAKTAKPGATFAQVGMAANAVIEDGLLRLGLITEKGSGQVKRWYMHGLGHWLGMNVHDVGRYGVPLKPGMVFTNEPGIYIRADALDYLPDTPENKMFIEKVRPAFEKYKNIGVRIEDDLLVTTTGVDWLTKALPRKLEDIESFMKSNKRSQL
ncbi:MAG: aminopeptidase P family protein [Pyrinomonadaceae bacterium]